MKMFKFDLQLFGGGGKGGSSSSSSYSMSPQESQIASYQVANAEKAQPIINTILGQYSDAVKSQDFANQLGNAQGLISQGQSILTKSANGQLNPNLQQNMADSIRTAVNSTVGNTINSLGNRGVINSSVTNKGLNDISANVADSLAKSYLQGLGTQAQLANGLISTANAGYSPYQTLGQLAGNLGSTFTNSAMSSLSGKGTQSKSEDGAGLGDMLLSTALGLGTGWAGKQMGLKF